MPWYNKYFFQIFYGTVAFILVGSAVQMRKSIKQSKQPSIQRQYKDTAK